MNLVSKVTILRKRSEARAERERARVLGIEAAELRSIISKLQHEEKRLGAQADDWYREVVNMEWQEPMLEKKMADIEKTRAVYLRESADTEKAIKMYQKGIIRRRDQEAELRQDAENKKREADQLRVQAGQDCVLGIDFRTHGMEMKANPILRSKSVS